MARNQLEHKYEYRRRLPHLQPDQKALFLTFCTHARWVLPESARSLILDCCLREHMRMYQLEAMVVMPDHVHMILWALRNANGSQYSLPVIMKKLKSLSAHLVNAHLGRKGPVWQEEFFDHAVRQAESLEQKIDYILLNPVRKRLCSRPEEYRWLWRRPADEVVRPTPDATHQNQL